MTDSPIINSFSDLQIHAGDFLLSLAPPASQWECERQRTEYRAISDTFCKHAVRYLHRRRPRSDQEIERMQRRIMPRVKDDLACNFAFIPFLVEGFLSWALSRLFDWMIGKWWLKDHTAQTTVCDMAADVCAPASQDDYE